MEIRKSRRQKRKANFWESEVFGKKNGIRKIEDGTKKK